VNGSVFKKATTTCITDAAGRAELATFYLLSVAILIQAVTRFSLYSSSFYPSCKVSYSMSRSCQQQCGRLAFQENNGYFHKSCCRKCYNSSGARHGGPCAQRNLSTTCSESAAETSQEANRNWQPRHVTIPSSSLVVPVPPAKNYHILSLGLQRGLGRELLKQNPEYSPYVFDVRDVLARQSDYIGGPYGTDAATKAQVGQLDGFRDVLNTATVSVLTHQFIILGCKSGHHRSVAVAEMLYEKLTRPPVREMQVHCFHYELATVSERVGYEEVLQCFFRNRIIR